MDNLEKVEKLRERANISYEEARRVLEENNWDMLDAIVALEKEGKTAGPVNSEYSTSYEQQTDYEPVKETVYDSKNAKKHAGNNVGAAIRKFFKICKNNSFCIRKEENLVFKIPLLLMLLLVIWSWKLIAILLIVGLFFGLRYSFEGKDDLKEANDFMDTAGRAADKVKGEFSRRNGQGGAEEKKEDLDSIFGNKEAK